MRVLEVCPAKGIIRTVNQGYLEETGMLVDLVNRIDRFMEKYEVDKDGRFFKSEKVLSV